MFEQQAPMGSTSSTQAKAKRNETNACMQSVNREMLSVVQPAIPHPPWHGAVPLLLQGGRAQLQEWHMSQLPLVPPVYCLVMMQVPVGDNYYAALNSAVFSDGSFVYVPKGVKSPMELSTYFRINASETGQVGAAAGCPAGNPGRPAVNCSS